MDRYGLVSGKNVNTIADKAFMYALDLVEHWIFVTRRVLSSRVEQRKADSELKYAVRQLVKAARDVQRQRSFERGIEAFAAMPFKADIVSAPEQVRPNRWTPGTYCGE